MGESSLGVEFVMATKDVPDWYREMFESYKKLETFGRFIVTVPPDWSGFKDGTVLRILREFNEGVYIAIAYISGDENECVTDLDGGKVDRFDITDEGGCRSWKYVKKRLRVVRVINEKTEAFVVQGYFLNLKYPEPIVKVLDVYSEGKTSGLRLDMFLNRGERTPAWI